MITEPIFTPVNDLERSLQEAQEGRMPYEAFMEQLVVSELFMPSRVPVDRGPEDVIPLVWNREGARFAGVFTSLERMAPHQEKIRGYVRLSGAEFFSRPAPGWGLLINPGWTVGMVIPEHGVEEIRNKLSARGETSRPSKARGMDEADAAIRAARAGRMPMSDMLATVLAAQVLVPLAEPPVMEGDSMVRWKPATVTQQRDGESFVSVFTDEALDAEYAKSRPEYPYRLQVGADWLLGVLPPGHGLAFNIGGDENTLEWPASGIAAYLSAAPRHDEDAPRHPEG